MSEIDQAPRKSGLFACVQYMVITCAVVAMTACGGGGSSQLSAATSTTTSTTKTPDQPFTTSNSWHAGVFKSADSFANKCAFPRTGTDPATNAVYPDKKGTTTDENNFLRSWSNDTYLWYSEIPDVNPANYTDPLEYFDLLKTTALTASGKEKDHFHFTYESSDWYALSETGVSAGYGFELAWISDTVPRNVVIAYTEPGSPAANANLMRGAKIIKVDGYDFVNGSDNATVNKLNAGVFPAELNAAHTFEVQDVGATTTHTVTLTSANVTKTPVQNVNIIDTPTGKVGYLLFNDHIKTAERGLYDAINQLNGVKDLVLDIRYNGGGYLYIASELAYMIAGGQATTDKVFEKTMFNDKHASTDIFGQLIKPTPFYNEPTDIGGSLPTLNLPRVFVITSGDTCSASESIINGLRGVDVEVIQIGSKTCGKPYGFYPQDNCGTTYFSIQFKGVNNKGFGEYSDGFVPSTTDNGMDNIKGCSLGDDLTHALGDTAEKNLATALNYRATGVCSATVSNGVTLQKMSNASTAHYSDIQASLKKEPGLTNRIMH